MMKHYKLLWRVIILVLLLAVFSASCNTDTTVTESQIAPPGQKFLFVVWYDNCAWGYENTGMYIDRNGNVYSYDLSDRDPRSENYPVGGPYSEVWLEDKFSAKRQYIETIDIETLDQMFLLVEPASLGTLTDPKGTGGDMGETRYIAFLYDDDNGDYREVLLYKTGDCTIENTSSEAPILRDWLLSMVRDHHLGIPIDILS